MAHEIFEAIEAGDLGRVRELASDPAAASARDEHGLSAVLQAQYHGRTEMVDALLTTDPELDVFEAAAVGRGERVRQLVEADPRLVQARAPDGFTPLHLAAFFNHVAVAEHLLERGAEVDAVAENEQLRVTPLHSASAAGATEIAIRLLEAGADPNARQRGGFTPLHAAAQNGDAELARALVARGADPDQAKDDGVTARALAGDTGFFG